MQLFGSYTSPYVRHIRTKLALLNLEYEFQETDFASSARLSPAKRVPFLKDGKILLTDSSSILMYVKQKAGESGFADPLDFELYAMANTVLDAEINLFILEGEGITPETSAYMKRQRKRVLSGLEYLNDLMNGRIVSMDQPSDGELRIGCLLAWAKFRNRFEFAQHDSLSGLVNALDQNLAFIETAPPS